MGEHRGAPMPRRFRRRLTGAFVLVAAVAGGALAVTTYTLSTGYRNRTFDDRSADEARVALALAPGELTESSFERLQAAYESRTGASTLARSPHGVFSSSPGLVPEDIPAALLHPPADELARARTTVDGVERLVLATERNGDAYWFFFSREAVEDSLRDLRAILAVSWLLTVVAAALVGRSIARRTLQPVRDASEAARRLASGLLETRLEARTDDEFGQWSASFNDMADALQRTIGHLEAAAARERQLTADAAHELRTPLTSMAATAALLEADLDALPDPTRRAARLLVGEVKRLQELVLELLELARVDSGAEPVSTEPLDLHAAVHAVVGPVQAAGPDGAAADIRVAVPDGLVATADRTRLRRVLHNLVDNALRHGGPPVEIAGSTDGAWAVIDVRDHGPGVRPEEAETVFDRFAKSDRSRASGGSGLGLAIAAGHTTAMGGSLVVTNHPSGGAVFSLRLPACNGSSSMGDGPSDDGGG